jgi:hypothetical protein
MLPALVPARHIVRRLALVILPLGTLSVMGVAFGSDFRAALSRKVAPPPHAELVNVPGRGGAAASLDIDSLVGRSGKLRAVFLTSAEVEGIPGLLDRLGTDAVRPGIRTVSYRSDGTDFAFITLKPWREKRMGFVNSYHVGWWPGERRIMPVNYSNPVGFIEVTADKADLRLSTHFTLRDFITHDQDGIWPKYVVLREELLDKLELVLETLEAQGVPAKHAVVLSGFRTPQYNVHLTFEGAAYASRHQFGDAADVIIDADHDGRMDDLNRDGVVDFQDTDVINRAVERVEKQYPDLVGGLGLYRATGPTGPFAHIDVRGTRARWTNLRVVKRASSAGTTVIAPAHTNEVDQAVATGKCHAEASSSLLCKAGR